MPFTAVEFCLLPAGESGISTSQDKPHHLKSRVTARGSLRTDSFCRKKKIEGKEITEEEVRAVRGELVQATYLTWFGWGF